jgi:hypothetical protein
MGRLAEFKNVLKTHRITKCYVSEGFDFESEFPEGEIRVNTDDIDILNELYRLFTEDGYITEEQNLFIWFMGSYHIENFTI